MTSRRLGRLAHSYGELSALQPAAAKPTTHQNTCELP